VSERPYEKSAAFEWTQLAYRLILDGKLRAQPIWADGVLTVLVEGQCPGCDHMLADRQVGTAVTGAGTATRGVRGTAVRPDLVCTDVTCECREPHSGAPEGIAGCGVSFRIELVADSSDT